MKLILLLGSSSAGKSTLCDALVREQGWYTHGCDQVGQIIERERLPILSAILREKNLIERLSPYLNESAIIALATTGQFNISHEGITINHQFRTPEYQGLEAVLSRAGFVGSELAVLSELLYQVGEACNASTPNPYDRMLDDIFKLPPDASVIIDDVPGINEDVSEMIQDFKARLIEHSKADGHVVEFAIVLAFCPPKALSERIQGRNKAADISGDLRNKREGLFPFLQLSQLISTAKADGAIDEAMTLSKLQLLMIALRHLPSGITEGETKKAKAMFKAGAHEYRKLMKEFNLSETSHVTVSPREDLGAHAVIDLSQGTSPSELALELISKTRDIPRLSTLSPGQ